MRVSVLRAAGDLAVEERPDPVPSPNEVLVRVASEGGALTANRNDAKAVKPIVRPVR